jgi:hypothetical protein
MYMFLGDSYDRVPSFFLREKRSSIKFLFYQDRPTDATILVKKYRPSLHTISLRISKIFYGVNFLKYQTLLILKLNDVNFIILIFMNSSFIMTKNKKLALWRPESLERQPSPVEGPTDNKLISCKWIYKRRKWPYWNCPSHS